MKKDFFKATLHSIGQVHVALGYFRMRLAWCTKEFFHAIREMPCQPDSSIGQHPHSLIAPQWLEVVEVELKTSVSKKGNFSHPPTISRLAIRSKPHDFAFIAIFLVADEFTNHGVEAAQGVWQIDPIKDFDLVVFATGHHGGDKIARSVVTKARSFFPWGAEIGTGDVGDVMFDVMLLKVQLARIDFERFSQ